MPLRRVVKGRPARRNVEEQELPNAPEVQPQGELTNAEFREAIQMLSQVVTKQWKGGRAEDAPSSSWACFEETFLGLFFPRELKEAKELEFEVDDWVYLKVSPMKGVMRFDKKGKPSPRYIVPYRISKRVGNVAYELELPQELVAVHPVCHISMLKKCMGVPSLIIPTENIGIKGSLSYEEILVQILDRQVRKLRTKEVASVKVLWRNQFVKEVTWEAEENMKKRYPHLFESGEVLN
ncbi:hypothetical protein MTR67_048353 [Solanum verrucosum]|uniref:Uncharacterized protein n=1 Tax=Solanum verrucosum TaxID=315347 RepID=A0AAF0UXT1_SOLVR|nr:hypothetical protein MTR67_048353 [Solanum verrucosum]